MKLDLRYFDPDEFRDWFPSMSPRLLMLQDSLRHQLGRKIKVSPHPLALGRNNGEDDPSQHNIDRWGEVRANDVFVDDVTCRNTVNRVIGVAIRTGFTGIGFYPDWDPQPGFHFDVRTSARPGEPALWGMVDDGEGQYQVSLEKALERMK